jgi:hypothetical protein
MVTAGHVPCELLMTGSHELSSAWLTVEPSVPPPANVDLTMMSKHLLSVEDVLPSTMTGALASDQKLEYTCSHVFD